MCTATMLFFDAPDLGRRIQALDSAELDQLDFGVIGIDADATVRVYNGVESSMAGLSPERVIGKPLFTAVAPCMNNFMVAQRFDDAAEGDAPLDVTINYVLTLRMKPCKVRLRLVAVPGAVLRYVLVDRRPA